MLLFLCTEYLFCSVPDDFKVNPGAVEALAVHPTDPDKVNVDNFLANTYILK